MFDDHPLEVVACHQAPADLSVQNEETRQIEVAVLRRRGKAVDARKFYGRRVTDRAFEVDMQLSQRVGHSQLAVW